MPSIEHYPDRFRRVSYRDPDSGKALVFLTNNFDLPALTIAQLYKCRWRVELFFKWVKQNLRIKHFFDTSDNAVKTQVWIAICVYVLVAIVRKELRLELSLSQILQILSVNVYEQVSLAELVEKPHRKMEPRILTTNWRLICNGRMIMKPIMDLIVKICGHAASALAFAGSAPAQNDTAGKSSRIRWIGVVPRGTASWHCRIVLRGQSFLNALTRTTVLICGRILASLSGLGLA